MDEDVEAALADLNQAGKLDSKSAVSFRTRGNVHEMIGDFPAALHDYEEAIHLDPIDSVALADLHCCRPTALMTIIEAVRKQLSTRRLPMAVVNGIRRNA